MWDHSRWMVAVKCCTRRLTGDKVAKMLKHQWQIFGLPNVIRVRRAGVFRCWFQSLAADLGGVRQAFSQACHHQANGRAEMAGQQLIEKLRKMQADEGINSADCLPAALKIFTTHPEFLD